MVNYCDLVAMISIKLLLVVGILFTRAFPLCASYL